MNKQRRRPLKQLCGCPEQNFRLVWWHEASCHNDHIWICLGCQNRWLEWIPAHWPGLDDGLGDETLSVSDAQGTKWSITEWETSRFRFTTKDSILDGERGYKYKVAILARN